MALNSCLYFVQKKDIFFLENACLNIFSLLKCLCVIRRFFKMKGNKEMSLQLFIPGPVNVEPDVLEKMATVQIAHRSKTATQLQERISKNLQILMNT